MNWDEIEENWKLFNGKVRSHWGKLTDDDVELANGKRGELLGLVTIEKVTYPDRLNAEEVIIDTNLVHAGALCRGRPHPIPGGLRWDRCLSTASASVESDEDDRRLDLASDSSLVRDDLEHRGGRNEPEGVIGREQSLTNHHHYHRYAARPYYHAAQ